MPATITPISEKQGQRLGKLQEAERLHAEMAIMLADLRVQYEANPFGHDRIGNAGHEASKRACALDSVLNDIWSLSCDLSDDEYDARESARAMGGRR